MGFEWNEEKAVKNFQKHGIAFRTATRDFQDENRLVIFDDEHSRDEDRYIAIGKVKNVLFVIYVERAENIRIISARLATKREKEMYYGNSIL